MKGWPLIAASLHCKENKLLGALLWWASVASRSLSTEEPRLTRESPWAKIKSANLRGLAVVGSQVSLTLGTEYVGNRLYWLNWFVCFYGCVLVPGQSAPLRIAIGLTGPEGRGYSLRFPRKSTATSSRSIKSRH